MTKATARGARRPRRPSATALATSVMLNPETASRCAVPLRANASARSRPIAARSPSTMPATTAPSGSGTRRTIAVARTVRIPASGSGRRAAGGGRARDRAVRASAPPTPPQSAHRARSTLAPARARAPAAGMRRTGSAPAGHSSAIAVASAAAGSSGSVSRRLSGSRPGRAAQRTRAPSRGPASAAPRSG